MRRVFWLAVGLGAGVTIGLAVTRWARGQTERYAPASVGRQLTGVVGDVGTLLRQAAAEFRTGAAEKEAEIRSALRE